MRRMFGAMMIASALAFMATPAQAAPDECYDAMIELSDAQAHAFYTITIVDSIEAQINAPGFDPVADAYAYVELGWAIDNMIEALNTASLKTIAHALACYA